MRSIWNSASGFARLTGPQTFNGTQKFGEGHRLTLFVEAAPTITPTIYGTAQGDQGVVIFGSFQANGTTTNYGGLGGQPLAISVYQAAVTCSYTVFQNGGGLKDAGGRLALSVTGDKIIGMGGTLTVTGLTTCTGGLTIGSGSALKLGNAAVPAGLAGVFAATTNSYLTLTDSTGTVYRIPCIV
jgi:hypothetical protein